jgi:hypothetical protein
LTCPWAWARCALLWPCLLSRACTPLYVQSLCALPLSVALSQICAPLSVLPLCAPLSVRPWRNFDVSTGLAEVYFVTPCLCCLVRAPLSVIPILLSTLYVLPPLCSPVCCSPLCDPISLPLTSCSAHCAPFLS